MSTLKETKTCLLCSRPLKGRSDKKFCDDSCRAGYNNELRSAANQHMRSINNALGRNRRILANLLPEPDEVVKTTQEKLLEKGFLFKYITHLNVDRNGNTCYYCYDYGYQLLGNDLYLLVRTREK